MRTFLICMLLLFPGCVLFALSDSAPPILLKAKVVLDGQAQKKQVAGLEEAFIKRNKLYLIQFAKPITQQDKLWLKEEKIDVEKYIPEFAFLASVSEVQLKQLEKNKAITRLVHYDSSMKVAPKFSYEKNQPYIVRIVKGQGTFIKQLIQHYQGQISEVKEDYLVAMFSEKVFSLLIQSEEVTFIEKQQKTLAPSMNEASQTLSVSGKKGVRALGLTGKNQIITLADRGIDTSHKDLMGQFAVAPIYWRGPFDEPDANSHGTFIAGQMVGTGKLSQGKYQGLAPEAKLLFQGIGCKQNGFICSYDLVPLFDQAEKYGSKIHVISYTGNNVYDTLAATADEYVYKNQDFNVFFAAGNYGEDKNGKAVQNSVGTPSIAKNVIAVGNSMQQGIKEKRNPTSSMGFASDGRVKPDLLAPGTDIVSLNALNSTYEPIPVVNSKGKETGEYDFNYTKTSGTSLAAPLAAASAALLRQYFVDFQHRKPSAALIKAALINGADDLGYGWGSREQGWGRINVKNSVAPDKGRKIEFVDERVGLGTGEEKEYRFQVKAGQILKFSLVWSDYEGSIEASKALVNDLDLEIKDPLGKVYTGNCFKENTSASCTKADRINNVENIYIRDPNPGIYTVKVKGYNVPMDTQSFALVASGKQISLQGQQDHPSEKSSLKAPQNVMVTQVNPTSITLSWSIPQSKSDASGYIIYQNNKEIGQVDQLQNSFRVSGLKVKEVYQFSLRTKDKFGHTSKPSEPLAIRISDKPEKVNDTAPKNWEPNHTYSAGDLIIWENKTYLCLSKHISSISKLPNVQPETWMDVEV